MTAAESFDEVAWTALGVARMRALESSRPDRLFDDPFAGAFVAAAAAEQPERGSVGESDGESGMGSGLTPAARAAVAAIGLHVTVRTRFYDDYLRAACDAGCRQVVLLAAGLDARAFRLEWPQGTRLFELDRPGMLSFKAGVLAGRRAAPRCARTAVAADLTGDWTETLAGAGFDPSLRTAWLAEGILVYLAPADAERLLTAIGRLSAPGSRLSCESADIASILKAGPVTGSAAFDRIVATWKGGLDDLRGWLGRHGWAVEAASLPELAAGYGRPAAEAAGGELLAATYGAAADL